MDRVTRFTPWKPERMVLCDANGDENPMSKECIISPHFNIFEGVITDWMKPESEGDSDVAEVKSESSDVPTFNDPPTMDLDHPQDDNMIDLIGMDSDDSSVKAPRSKAGSKGGLGVRVSAATGRTGLSSARNANEKVAVAPPAHRVSQSVQNTSQASGQRAAGDVTMSSMKSDPIQANEITAQSTPAPTTRQKPTGGVRDQPLGVKRTSGEPNTANKPQAASPQGKAGRVKGDASGLPEQVADLWEYMWTHASSRGQGVRSSCAGGTHMQAGSTGGDMGEAESSGRKRATKVSNSKGGHEGRGTKRSRVKGSVEAGPSETAKKAK
ncbi:hypothetical protein FRC08_000871 [Ceratobasidium sp. 394]|nr:hypothetical protein FRC08_000871 [Ceratobasidium sp. 394]